jgi:hypothetical protein
MESEHCDRAPKVLREPRPVKTHSANRRGSARRSIHTLRPCGTHKHHASEKIVNRCCRRPLLAEAPLAMYGVRNRSPQFVRSIELESAERHLPYQSRRSFLRFYRILPLREKSSARGVIRFKDSCAALKATFPPMLERGSRAAHYGTGSRIPIRSHSRCNRWGGLGPVETRAEDGASDKTASISR